MASLRTVNNVSLYCITNDETRALHLTILLNGPHPLIGGQVGESLVYLRDLVGVDDHLPTRVALHHLRPHLGRLFTQRQLHSGTKWQYWWRQQQQQQ